MKKLPILATLFTLLLCLPPLVHAGDFKLNTSVTVKQAETRNDTYFPGEAFYDNTLRAEIPCIAQIEREMESFRKDPHVRSLMGGFAREAGSQQAQLYFSFYADQESMPTEEGSLKEWRRPFRVLIMLTGRPFSEIRQGLPSGRAQWSLAINDNGTCDAEAILEQVRNQQVLTPDDAPSFVMEPTYTIDGIPAEEAYRKSAENVKP